MSVASIGRSLDNRAPRVPARDSGSHGGRGAPLFPKSNICVHGRDKRFCAQCIFPVPEPPKPVLPKPIVKTASVLTLHICKCGHECTSVQPFLAPSPEQHECVS